MAAPDFDALFQQAGQRFNVDPDLLRAVSGAESGGNFDTPDSSAGAFGGMQIMPQTYATVAKKYGLSGDPRSPANQIAAGAAVLSENLDRYGNVPDALRAYNGGTDSSRWNNPETSAYVGRVAGFYQPGAVGSGSTPSADTSSGTSAPYQVASANTGTMSDAAPDPNAPPAASSSSSDPWAGADAPSSGSKAATASPASLSDDDVHALLTGGKASSGPASASTPPAAPQASGAMAGPMSDDALHSLLTGTPPATAASASSAPPPTNAPAASIPSSLAGPAAVAAGLAAAPAGSSSPSYSNSLSPSAGLPQTGFGGGLTTAAEGVPNALNRLGAFVDRNTPALASLDQAVLPAIGVAQPAQTANALTSDIAARDKTNAGSFAYGAGKVAGDVAITAPILAAGGAAVDAAGEAVPWAGNLLTGAANGVRALPAGSALVNTGAAIGRGAIAGATGAAATSGQSSAPIGQQVEQGAILGGAVGVTAPYVGKVASGIAGAFRGGSISPEAASLASLARGTYNIPLTAGQISESPAVKYVASAAKAVPLSGGGAEDAASQAAFNTAVSRTFGENADKITPGVMQAARDRLGNVFNQVASTGSFQADHQLVSDLADIETNAQQVLPQSEWRPISTQLDNVLGAVDSQGNISGDAYQTLTRQGAPLGRAQASSDPNVAFYARQVKDALDDALARGLPQDQQVALAQARSQYKALMTVEPLVGKSTLGNISPPSLMGPVQSSFGNIAFTGGGPLGDLARIGQLMKAPPDSGTASRLGVLGTLGTIGTAVTGAATGIGMPTEAGYALGALGGTALAARGAQAWLNSPFITNRLIASGLPGATNPVGTAVAQTSNALAPAAATFALQNPRRNLLVGAGQ